MGGGSAAMGNPGVNSNTGMAMTPIPGMNPSPVNTPSNALAPGIVNYTTPGPSPKPPQQQGNPYDFPNWNGSNIPFYGFNPSNFIGNSNQGNQVNPQTFSNNPFLMRLGGNK